MTVKVGVTVVEGAKTRVQPYQGLIIAMHKHALTSTITVRKTFQGVGVERVFPIHSPLVAIEPVQTAGVPRVRRAKLDYLRDRVGKAARLKQVFVSKKADGGAAAAVGARPAAAAPAAPAAPPAPAAPREPALV